MRGLKIKKNNQKGERSMTFMGGDPPVENTFEFDNEPLPGYQQMRQAEERNRTIQRQAEVENAFNQAGAGGSLNQDGLNNLSRENPDNGVNSSSYLSGNELDQDTSQDAYIRRMMLRKSNPAIQALPENALFPGYGANPMTQQGWSGYGFSIPTIYGSGSLYPWAVVDARKRAEQEAEMQYEAELSKSLPEYSHIANFTKDPGFYDAQYNDFKTNIEDKYKQIAKEKHGDERLWSVLGANEIRQKQEKYKQASMAHDQVWSEANKMLSDTTGFYSKTSKDVAGKYINFIDQFNANSTDPENIDKFAKMQQDIRKQANVADTVKKQLDIISPQFYLSIEEFKQTGDYDAFKKIEGSASFLKKDNGKIVFDKNGVAEFDEEAFDKYAKDAYQNVYTEESKYTPSYGSYKEELKNGLKQTFKVDLDTVGKYNAGARVWEDKQKQKITIVGGTADVTLKDQNGVTYTVPGKNPLGFEKYNKSGKEVSIDVSNQVVYDPDSRKYFRIEGTVNYKPQVSQVLTSATFNKDAAQKIGIDGIKSYPNESQIVDLNNKIAEYNSKNNTNLQPSDVYTLGEERTVTGSIGSGKSDKETITMYQYDPETGKRIGSVSKQVPSDELKNTTYMIYEPSINSQLNTLPGYAEDKKIVDADGNTKTTTTVTTVKKKAY